MTMYYQEPSPVRRRPETDSDPYHELDEAVQEQFGFGYQTYYMRRLIAAEHALFAKRQAAITWNPQEQAQLYETAERWEKLLATYCHESLLQQEERVASLLHQPWMREAQSNALEALDSHDAAPS